MKTCQSHISPLLNSPEAIDDFTRPLTPLQRLKHEAELPGLMRGGKMAALTRDLLSQNSSSHSEQDAKWPEMIADRGG